MPSFACLPGLVLRVFIGLATAVAAWAAPAGELAFAVDLPPAYTSLAEVGNTVAATVARRSWKVKEQSADRIVINLVHRGVDATVTFVVVDKKLLAYCEGYSINSSGKRGKPEQPTGWLRNLQSDLNKTLPTAALREQRPAAAATPPPAVASQPVATPPPAAPLPVPAAPPSPAAAPVAGPAITAPAAPASAPAAPPAPPPPADAVQLVQFPEETISPVTYYARVYLLRPRATPESTVALRIFDETPGAQGSGPGRSIEIGNIEADRVLGWNRPAGVLSLRADTGSPATPRLAIEIAAGKSYYIVAKPRGASAVFSEVPEAEGKRLLEAARPATVGATAPDSLDAYLVAAASDGRADAVKKFLNADSGRGYDRALAASIDQGQPQVTNMLLDAGATLPTDNTPDARFRNGSIFKAMGDKLMAAGKSPEAKKYYEQAMTLFNAVKPELMAAAEAKFKKAQDTAKKESFWGSVGNIAGKALAAYAASQKTPNGTTPAATTPTSNQAGMAQLLALKESGTFDQFLAKVKATNATTANGTVSMSNKEIPKEVSALLETLMSQAFLEKNMSERCDLLIAEMQKQMAQPKSG